MRNANVQGGIFVLIGEIISRCQIYKIHFTSVSFEPIMAIIMMMMMILSLFIDEYNWEIHMVITVGLSTTTKKRKDISYIVMWFLIKGT